MRKSYEYPFVFKYWNGDKYPIAYTDFLFLITLFVKKAESRLEDSLLCSKIDRNEMNVCLITIWVTFRKPHTHFPHELWKPPFEYCLWRSPHYWTCFNVLLQLQQPSETLLPPRESYLRGCGILIPRFSNSLWPVIIWVPKKMVDENIWQGWSSDWEHKASLPLPLYSKY